MNQITKGKPETDSVSKGRLLNFSVAAASLWMTRHLLLGMLFYFAISQIPGIMVKADLIHCVGISVILSVVVFLLSTAFAIVFSLSFVTYELFTDSEAFYEGKNRLNFDWASDTKFRILGVFTGIMFNGILLKAIASFCPDLIMFDGWSGAWLSGCIIVAMNRSLHAVQKHVVKLKIPDEIKSLGKEA